MPAAVPILLPILIAVGKAIVVALIVKAIMKPKIPTASTPTNNGNRVQLSPATNNKLPVLYGTSWASPIITEAKMSTDQKYMWYVMSVGEVTDSGTIYFDGSNGGGLPDAYWGDKKMSFNASRKYQVDKLVNAAGQETAFDSEDFHCYFYNNGSSAPLYGAPSAISVLQNSSTGGGIESAQRWTSTDEMYKTAFAIIRIKYNQDKNITGVEQATFKVRNTLQAPGSVLKDYLINTRYGCGLPAEMVDTLSLDALNTYSNQTINYTDTDGSTKTQSRYLINGPIDTGRDVYTNLLEICEACDTWLNWDEVESKWGVVINRSITQSGTTSDSLTIIDDSKLIGGINIVPTDLNSAYRSVEVQYPSALIKDQFSTAYVNIADYPNIKVNPNEPPNKLTMKLELVNDNVQAQYLAARRLLQSRDELCVEFRMDYSGILLSAGDIVKINHGWYGWGPTTDAPNQAYKYFRITRIDELTDGEGSLTVNVQAREYNDTIYENNSLTAFKEAPNTGISDPRIVGTPLAPTITNADTTGSIPSFQVDCVVTTVGSVNAVEFWYSDTEVLGTNNYKLYETQYYTSAPTYPKGEGESTVVSGLSSGSYYWRVRMVSTNYKSDFSPPSVKFDWNPNPVVASGATFAASFSPSVYSVPRDGDPLVPDLTTIQPELYGIAGGSPVEFSPAQSDSDPSFQVGYWRIGDSPTTGYSAITTDGIIFDLSSTSIYDGGSYVGFGAATSMSKSPAYLRVPIRYKDNTGTVYQTTAAKIQFVYLDKGIKGSDGLNGTRTAILDMYKWSTTQPTTFPMGVSIYTWATGQFTAPSITNGWTTTPTSPISGSTLYVARQIISEVSSTTTTSVNWNADSSMPISTAGIDGKRTALIEVYKWSTSAPTLFPVGVSTYTWATGEFTATSSMNGWALEPGAAIPGYTLYACSARLTDSGTSATSDITWATNRAYAVGFAGANGSDGLPAVASSASPSVVNFYQGLDGTWQNYIDVTATFAADTVITKTQRVSVASNTISYSTTSGSDDVTVTTNGSGQTIGEITFTLPYGTTSITQTVPVVLNFAVVAGFTNPVEVEVYQNLDASWTPATTSLVAIYSNTSASITKTLPINIVSNAISFGTATGNTLITVDKHGAGFSNGNVTFDLPVGITNNKMFVPIKLTHLDITSSVSSTEVEILQKIDTTWTPSPYNLVVTYSNSTTSITKTQPISVSSNVITYGTATGNSLITIDTTGASSMNGTVTFDLPYGSTNNKVTVPVKLSLATISTNVSTTLVEFFQTMTGAWSPASSNLVVTYSDGATSISKTVPISVVANGISFGTETGNASITVSKTGTGVKTGSVSFDLPIGRTNNKVNVPIRLTPLSVVATTTPISHTFPQLANGKYTPATKSILSTFTDTRTGDIATMTINAAVSNVGLITFSGSNANYITATTIGSSTKIAAVEFKHTIANVSVGTVVDSQVFATFVTTPYNGLDVTISDVAVSYLSSPPTIIQKYSNGQTFIRAANEGEWSPTPVSNVISTKDTIVVKRGATILATQVYDIAYNTSSNTFTATANSTGSSSVGGTFIFDTANVVSNDKTYRLPFSYSDSYSDAGGAIEVNVVRGGARGSEGPVNIVRYGRFSSRSQAASYGSPQTTNGLTSAWVRSPDMFDDIGGAYTHTTSQWVPNVTLGLPKQYLLSFSGTGGGSYTAGAKETTTITIANGHSTSQSSSENFTFTPSGVSGSLTLNTAGYTSTAVGYSIEYVNGKYYIEIPIPNVGTSTWYESTNLSSFTKLGSNFTININGVPTSASISSITGFDSKFAVIARVGYAYHLCVGGSLSNLTSIKSFSGNGNSAVKMANTKLFLTLDDNVMSIDRLADFSDLSNWAFSVVSYTPSYFGYVNATSPYYYLFSYDKTKLFVSTDGNVWILSKATSNGMKYAVGNGRLVVLDSANKAVLSTSDGIVWTTTSTSTLATNNGYSDFYTFDNIVFVNGVFFSTYYNSNVYATSSNGISWTLDDYGPTNNYSVTRVNNNVVYGWRGNQNPAYSTDSGTTWTDLPTTEQWKSGDSVMDVDGVLFDWTSSLSTDGLYYLGIKYSTGTLSSEVIAGKGCTISASVVYYPDETSQTTTTTNVSFTLSPDINTSAGLVADIVSKFNAAKGSLPFEALVSGTSVKISFTYVGNVPTTVSSFTVSQSNGTVPSTVVLTAGSSVDGKTPSSLTFNNVKEASNRVQLIVSTAPTISGGIYTWDVTEQLPHGSLVVGTSVIIDLQKTSTSSATEFSGVLGDTASNTTIKYTLGSGQISLDSNGFGATAKTAIESIGSSGYIFVQGKNTSDTSLTVVFTASANTVRQAQDIATAFNSMEVAYTATAVNNTVVLTGSDYGNQTNITLGTFVGGSSGNAVASDYSITSQADGIPAYTLTNGTRSVITLTGSSGRGYFTINNVVDYGADAGITDATNPSGVISTWSDIKQKLILAGWYIVQENATQYRLIDCNPDNSGSLAASVTNGTDGTVAALVILADSGQAEVVTGDPLRWTFPVNTGRQVT